jgi:PAS domain S-box-containing protein
MADNGIVSSWPFQKKLLLLLSIVFLPAFAIVTGIGVRERGEEIEKARNKATLVAESLATQQEQVAASTKQLLSTLAQVPQVQSLDAPACDILFRELVNRNPLFEILTAETPDGNVFAASVALEGITVNIADRKHFRDALATRDFVAGEYMERRIAGAPIFVYSYPVVDTSGTIAAVMSAGVNMVKFAEFVAKAGMPQGYSVVFTDYKGVRLYRSPANDATPPGESVPESRFRVMAGGAASGTFETMAEDGIRRISAFRRVRLREDSPAYMYIVVGVPRGETVDKATRRMLQSQSLLTLALLAGVCLSWVLGRRLLIAPINKLAAATARFGEGKYDTRAGAPYAVNELGRLARSFDEMAALLEARETERKAAAEEIERAYAELETRIGERTAELTDANALLKEARDRLDSIIEFLPDAAFVIDTLGRVLFWNRAIEEMSGVSKTRILHREDYQYALSLHGEKRPVLADLVLCAANDWERELGYERFHRERDRCSGEIYLPLAYGGRGAYVWGAASVLRDRAGNIMGAIEIIRDISGHKRREKALRQSEERYRAMFEKNKAIELIIEPVTGNIVDANPAACAFYGYTREQFRSLRLADMTLLSAKELEAELDLARTEERDFFHFRHRLSDGAPRDVEIHSSPIETHGRTLLYFIIHDVTDRKRFENALQSSEERFRLLVESAPDAIFVQTEGLFAYVNQAGLRLFGATSADQLVGRPVLERIHPSSVEVVREGILHPGRSSTLPSERKYVALDGKILDVETYIAPISYANRDGALIFVRDITRRKRGERERLLMEQRLRGVQKAESLNRMAGAIAHNFNNMLCAVIGNLELALEDLPPESGVRHCVAEAMKASGRAAEISQFMLTYVGQTAGRKEPVDLAAVLRDSLALLHPALPSRTRLLTDFPPSGPMVNADRSHFRRILGNLVLNASEAIGEEEGSITLAIDEARASELEGLRFFPPTWAPKTKRYARFSVADTGSGLDPAIVEKIFDPFFSTKFVGRGLGLPVVLGLVRALDGAVGVESQPGKGATFTVYLPLLEKAAARTETERALPPLARGASVLAAGALVLVVDDEPIVLDTAESMLRRLLGFEVVTAADGFRAVEIFRARKEDIALVLLDFGLPGMDGWETLTALRKLRPDIPVVLVSGYDEAQTLPDAHPDQPQAFLHKPYELASLKEALDAVRRGTAQSATQPDNYNSSLPGENRAQT